MRYSLRTLIAISALTCVAAAFWDTIIEIGIRWFYLLSVIVFTISALVIRRVVSRRIFAPIAFAIPAIFLFVTACLVRNYVMNAGFSNWIEYPRYIKNIANGSFVFFARPVNEVTAGAINIDGGTLETMLASTGIGIFLAGGIGISFGFFLAPNRIAR